MELVTKKKAFDIAERAGWTFVQAFAATLLASGWFNIEQITDVSLLQNAGIAGIAAVISLVKSLVGTKLGNTDTASTLPADLDPAGKS